MVNDRKEETKEIIGHCLQEASFAAQDRAGWRNSIRAIETLCHHALPRAKRTRETVYSQDFHLLRLYFKIFQYFILTILTKNDFNEVNDSYNKKIDIFQANFNWTGKIGKFSSHIIFYFTLSVNDRSR